MSSEPRILIVDDQETNVELLQRILARAGYTDVVSTTDPRRAVALVHEAAPDLVLLDLHMPHLDGFGVMEALAAGMPPSAYLPILCLTADVSREVRERALGSGARDFLTKPFDRTEVLLRIRNLLETRSLYQEVARHRDALEAKVRERTRALEAAQGEILERLAQAAEMRDDDTGQHTRRVGETSAVTARALGMDEDTVELVRRAAPLHDVGKIGIPDAILLKPGLLTPEERAVMRTHTTLGARILARGRNAVMAMAEQVALCHHERWDGGGYPRGLRGEEIPLAARIVAVADFYDALASDRPYRAAWPIPRVLAEIEAGIGSHFDPDVAAAFLRAHAEGAIDEAYVAVEA
jgi:putative two-component system response regulator